MQASRRFRIPCGDSSAQGAQLRLLQRLHLARCLGHLVVIPRVLCDTFIPAVRISDLFDLRHNASLATSVVRRLWPKGRNVEAVTEGYHELAKQSPLFLNNFVGPCTVCRGQVLQGSCRILSILCHCDQFLQFQCPGEVLLRLAGLLHDASRRKPPGVQKVRHGIECPKCRVPGERQGIPVSIGIAVRNSRCTAMKRSMH
mmetsp:Transcript_128996/g.306039  ORF Transcript_128996/g.306039 Transcript_128996/m.306039 type:complete len:200 (-) Transcript_128996:1213-1812(-)